MASLMLGLFGGGGDEASAAEGYDADIHGPMQVHGHLPFWPDVHGRLSRFLENIVKGDYGEVAMSPDLPPSAAADATLTGKSAIQALVNARGAADELAVANKQAQSIARGVRIAAARAWESKKAYDAIYSVMERNSMTCEKNCLTGKEPEALPVPGLAMPALQPEYDLKDGYYLKRNMEDMFRLVREATFEAARSADVVARSSMKAQHAARAVAEALRLPGAPPPEPPAVEALQVLKPPRRPRDLAPFWLDLPYASTKGADPYVRPQDKAMRRSAADLLRGTNNFNPFEGTALMPDEGLDYSKIELKPSGPVPPVPAMGPQDPSMIDMAVKVSPLPDSDEAPDMGSFAKTVTRR